MNLINMYRGSTRPMDSWMDSGLVSYLHALRVNGGGLVDEEPKPRGVEIGTGADDAARLELNPKNIKARTSTGLDTTSSNACGNLQQIKPQICPAPDLTTTR